MPPSNVGFRAPTSRIFFPVYLLRSKFTVDRNDILWKTKNWKFCRDRKGFGVFHFSLINFQVARHTMAHLTSVETKVCFPRYQEWDNRSSIVSPVWRNLVIWLKMSAKCVCSIIRLTNVSSAFASPFHDMLAMYYTPPQNNNSYQTAAHGYYISMLQ